MGCGSSNLFDQLYSSPKFAHTMRQFLALKLTKSDMRQFHTCFCEFDFEHTERVVTSKLFDYLELDMTAFFEKAFPVYHTDHKNELAFQSFVVSLWNFCTLSKHALDMFAFQVYAQTDELEVEDFSQMVIDIHGKSKSNPFASSILGELAKMKRSTTSISADRFMSFLATHQALLYPVVQLQSSLQHKILGVGFWKRQTANRERMSAGQYLSIYTFLLPEPVVSATKTGNNGAGKRKNSNAHGRGKVVPLGDEVVPFEDHDQDSPAGNYPKRKSSSTQHHHQQQGNLRGSFMNNLPDRNTMANLTESAKMRLTASLQSMGVFKGGRVSGLAPASAPMGSAGRSFLVGAGSHSASSSQQHLNISRNPSTPMIPTPPFSRVSTGSAAAAAACILSPVVSPRDPRDIGKDRERGQREHKRRYSVDVNNSGASTLTLISDPDAALVLSGDYSHAGSLGDSSGPNSPDKRKHSPPKRRGSVA